MQDETPDLAGFQEALDYKRQVLGEHVTLLGPVTATWDPSVAIDPDTGKAYDPMASPTASARASAVVQAGVAYRHRPGFGTAASKSAAAGIFADADVLVILSSAAASAAIAVEVQTVVARDETYKVMARRFDGVTGIDRYLIFCSDEGR